MDEENEVTLRWVAGQSRLSTVWSRALSALLRALVWPVSPLLRALERRRGEKQRVAEELRALAAAAELFGCLRWQVPGWVQALQGVRDQLVAERDALEKRLATRKRRKRLRLSRGK